MQKLRQFQKVQLTLKRKQISRKLKYTDGKVHAKVHFYRCALNSDFCVLAHWKKWVHFQFDLFVSFLYFPSRDMNWNARVHISKLQFNEVKATVNIISNALFQALK